MARIRTIKPDFFTSESVSALPYSARLTFIGLWTYADDEWRAVDNVKLIRAAIWPLDDRTLGDIEKDIDELASHGMIVRYTVSGRHYLHIPGMGTHQRVNRPTASKLPAPPTSGNEMSAHEQLTSDSPPAHEQLTSDSPPAHEQLTSDSPPERNGKEGNLNGKEWNGVAAPSKPPAPTGETNPAQKRGTRLPENFTVTPEMVTWAHENTPGVDGRYETAKFRDYWHGRSGKDGTKIDWPATWRNWMRKAHEDNRRQRGPTTGANRHTSQRHVDPFADEVDLSDSTTLDNLPEHEKPAAMRSALTTVRCPEHEQPKIGDCVHCKREHGNARWYTDPAHWSERDRRRGSGSDFARVEAWARRQ